MCLFEVLVLFVLGCVGEDGVDGYHDQEELDDEEWDCREVGKLLLELSAGLSIKDQKF